MSASCTAKAIAAWALIVSLTASCSLSPRATSPPGTPLTAQRSSSETTSARAPIPSPSPLPRVGIPPGVIFQIQDALFQATSSGVTKRLRFAPASSISSVSPDGRYVAEGNWVMLRRLSDATTGSDFDLDARNDYVICEESWLRTSPGSIVAKAMPREEYSGYCCRGLPVIASLASQSIEPLAEISASCQPMAVSPDEAALAFSKDEAYILRFGQSPSPVVYGDFSLPPMPNPSLTGPAWAPNSPEIAWNLWATLSGEPQQGVVILDLVRMTGVLYPLEPNCTEGGRHLLWNPSRPQIAIVGCAGDFTVITDTGTTLFSAPNMSDPNPIWSADGSLLALRGEDALHVVSAETWSTIASLPAPSFFAWSPVGWDLLFQVHAGPSFLFDAGNRALSEVAVPEGATLTTWIQP